MRKTSIIFNLSVFALLSALFASPLLASEAELNIPVLSAAQNNWLMIGIFDLHRRHDIRPFPILEGQEDAGPQIHAGYLGNHIPDL